MMIRGSLIRKISPYLIAVAEGEEFRIAAAIDEKTGPRLTALGFPERPSHGDTILPSAEGKVASHNAHGMWRVRRDLPKEKRVTGQRLWRWKEWRGRDTVDRERIIDIEQWCYPREFMPPPGIELTYVQSEGQRFIVSPVLQKTAATEKSNLHVVNLFLELFGPCTIIGPDFESFHKLKIKRLAWELLPQGEQPFPKLAEFLERKWRPFAGDRARVIMDRQHAILSFRPDEIYEGVGGFSNYLAYVFKEKRLVVLESVTIDNAIYIFGEDWRDLSKKTKAEILQNGLHMHRIIHQTGWKKELAKVLADPDADLAA